MTASPWTYSRFWRAWTRAAHGFADWHIYKAKGRWFLDYRQIGGMSRHSLGSFPTRKAAQAIADRIERGEPMQREAAIVALILPP